MTVAVAVLRPLRARRSPGGDCGCCKVAAAVAGAAIAVAAWPWPPCDVAANLLDPVAMRVLHGPFCGTLMIKYLYLNNLLIKLFVMINEGNFKKKWCSTML